MVSNRQELKERELRELTHLIEEKVYKRLCREKGYPKTDSEENEYWNIVEDRTNNNKRLSKCINEFIYMDTPLEKKRTIN